MKTTGRHRFLFVFWLIFGKKTAYRNLRDAVSSMDDVDATWVPIEMDPPEYIAHIPPISMNHSLKYGLVARNRVKRILESGVRFDAAFFNHILPALFLNDFRRRVPSVDALDVTPASLARDGKPYYEEPRKELLPGLRKFKTLYARNVYNHATYLLPQSKYTQDSLVHDYSLPEEKMRTVVPGVNLQQWHVPRKRPVGTKRRRQLFSVLFVGADFHRKGGDTLLNVSRRPEFRDCRFHFVTRGFSGEQAPNVCIHSGLQENSETLLKLYAEADIFVLPTRSDFAPTNSICEAMATGLPVVSTGVGGINEFVSDATTGFIIPPDNEEALADRIRFLRENSYLRFRMSRNDHLRKHTLISQEIQGRLWIS